MLYKAIASTQLASDRLKVTTASSALTTSSKQSYHHCCQANFVYKQGDIILAEQVSHYPDSPFFMLRQANQVLTVASN